MAGIVDFFLLVGVLDCVSSWEDTVMVFVFFDIVVGFSIVFFFFANDDKDMRICDFDKKTKMWIFLQVPDFFFGDDLLFGSVLIDALAVTGNTISLY